MIATGVSIGQGLSVNQTPMRTYFNLYFKYLVISIDIRCYPLSHNFIKKRETNENKIKNSHFQWQNCRQNYLWISLPMFIFLRKQWCNFVNMYLALLWNRSVVGGTTTFLYILVFIYRCMTYKFSLQKILFQNTINAI